MELASASNFEYNQFPLFQTLWVPRRVGDLSKILTHINEWILKANKTLEPHRSWDTYCQRFALLDAGEENFTVARHYQPEVANTRDETYPLTFATPIHSEHAPVSLLDAGKSLNRCKGLDPAGFEVLRRLLVEAQRCAARQWITCYTHFLFAC